MGKSKPVPCHIKQLHGLSPCGRRRDGAEIETCKGIGQGTPVGYLFVEGLHKQPYVGCFTVNEHEHAEKCRNHELKFCPPERFPHGFHGMVLKKHVERHQGQDCHHAEPYEHLPHFHFLLFHSQLPSFFSPVNPGLYLMCIL